jgi:hypothetical protein
VSFEAMPGQVQNGERQNNGVSFPEYGRREW